MLHLHTFFNDMNNGFFNLEGKVAIITGGGSGIGKGCAKILAKAGAKVLVIGRRVAKLEQTKAEIEASSGVCEYFSADLMIEENCKAAVDYCIERFGRVDILVNSAGGTGAHGSLEEEFSTENLEHTLDMDFTSTFNCIKYSYPQMEASGGGSIINIASLAALRAKGPICYSAAKGAIQSLSRNLALRFGKMGIRVNTIYPGFIVSEMTEKIFEMPELEKKMRGESVLGLLGEIDDIAYCALYLASSEAKFVTGQDFVIDGGTIIK